MSRWHLKPKRFVGSLALDGRSAPVRFSVGVSAKGSAKGGCGPFLGLVYVVNPKLSRYSIGLR